jgi:hypothetical protein
MTVVKFTDVSVVLAASITAFIMEAVCISEMSASLHGATTQKAAIFMCLTDGFGGQ